MSEQAPPYATARDAIASAWSDVEILARVFGITPDEVMLRIIEAGIDAVLDGDPAVAELVAGLRALDLRNAVARAGGVAQQQKPRARVVPEPSHDVKVAAAGIGVSANQLQSDLDDVDAEPVVNVAPLTTAERRKAASFVRETRMALGMTQIRLAQALQISAGYVSMIERADTAVSSEAIRAAVAWARENRAAA